MRGLGSPDSTIVYASVLEALPMVAFLTDLDGRITYLSPEWERFTGNSARDVLDEGYQTVIHPDDRERAAVAWDASRAAGSPHRDEVRIRFGDGSYRWIVSQANPIRDAEDAIVCWCGILTDIHDVRLAEEGMARALEDASVSAKDAATRAHFVERLLDASDDCVKVLDLDARLISMSANGQKALAIMDFATVEGTNWTEFWSGDDRLAASAAVESARAGERGRFTGLFPVRGVDRWWDVTVTPILGADDRPERLLAVSRDVTDMLAAHRDLERSEERYRILGEALPGVTWAASPSGELTFVGERWTALHGKPQEGALGDSWIESVHPGDLERVIAAWKRALATSEPYDIQFRLRVASGAYRWFLVRALPVRAPDGTIARWIGVNVDIDDQRRADEAREQFVRLVEASDDFIGISDEAGNVTYVNGAGRRMLGLGTLKAANTTRRIDYFAPEDRSFFETTILKAVAREGRWTGEFRLRNFRTGELIPIWYNLFSLFNEANEVVGTATVSRDLRERHRVDVGMRALAETGAAMYGSLTFDGTVNNVAEAVVRSFATYCVVDALESDGSLRSVAAARSDPSAVLLLERAAAARKGNAEHPVARAIRHGESTLLAKIPDDWGETTGVRAIMGNELDRLDLRSVMYVPIRSVQDGRVYGALTCVLDATDSRGSYTAEDLRFAEEIAARAGLALDHARAYQRERRIAVTLQEASLPRVLPTVDHLYLSADYRPGNSEATIGGDWYDAFVLDDGRVMITVGDVLGNGLGAAVTMGKVRQAMQSVAMVLPNPNAMLAVADRTVRAQSADTYATALAGVFDPHNQEFTFASAGHPGPALRRVDGSIEEFVSPGMMLGLRSPGAKGTVTVPVPPGSTLVFFTDGLVEATRDMDEGHRRLHAAMADSSVASAANPAHALVEHVLAGHPATDDIAVLVAEIGPSGRFDGRLRTAEERATSTEPEAQVVSDEPGSIIAPKGGTVLTIQARLDEIATARSAVRTLMLSTDAPAAVVSLVEIVTGELVGNAIDHGTGSIVDVALRLLPGIAVLAVTNDGPAFERPSEELSALLYAERGRGLAMLTALGCALSIDCPTANRCTVTATIPYAAAGAV